MTARHLEATLSLPLFDTQTKSGEATNCFATEVVPWRASGSPATFHMRTGQPLLLRVKVANLVWLTGPVTLYASEAQARIDLGEISPQFQPSVGNRARACSSARATRQEPLNKG